MRRWALAPIVALAVLASTPGRALAVPITYTLSLAASGVVDGRPFTDEPVRVRLRADAADVSSGPGGTTLAIDCGKSVCAAYVGGLAFGIASTFEFKQPKGDPTRITLAVVGKNIERLSLVTPRFASYRLGTPIGPIEATAAFKAPLTVRVRTNGRPSTVMVTSITGHHARLEAR